MKLLLLLFAAVLFAGCQTSPPTELESSDGTKTTRYGAYFQNKKPVIDDKVRVDAIVTLGPERLPVVLLLAVIGGDVILA